MSYGNLYWRDNKLEQLGAPKEEVNDDEKDRVEFYSLLDGERLVYGEEIYPAFADGQLCKVYVGKDIDPSLLDKLSKDITKTQIVSVSGKWIESFGHIVGVRWF